MDEQLIITVIGKDYSSLLHDLTVYLKDQGASIRDCRMQLYNTDVVVTLVLNGSWNVLAKLETKLPSYAQSNDLQIQHARHENKPIDKKWLPYTVFAITRENPGIISKFCRFFAENGIQLQEHYTNTHYTSPTAPPQYSLHFTIGIREDSNLSEVRERFNQFSDQINIESVLEPFIQ